MYRQGDILFILRDGIDERVYRNVTNSDRKVQRNMTDNFEIVRGMNGNAHVLQGMFIAYGDGNPQWNQILYHVEVLKECKLIHPEHREIVIPEGFYEIRSQFETRGQVHD